MTRFRLLVAVLVIVCAASAAFAAIAWHPAIAPTDGAASATFAPDRVRHGAALAAIGNCTGCHSAPGQPAFSGGVPVETPFGTVYSSNITPDGDTGIGRWSEAAFIRAMRNGIDREGHHLYPAFPYNHYTMVTDDDDRALYAYLMTRTPARHTTPPTTLPFPLNIRAVMAGWNLLFFRPGPAPDAGQDARNHGAYLVEGLGHCGACHTPHNLLGAEKADAHLAGGMAEGWNAYALNASSPAPRPWTVDGLSFYLRHGWQTDHGVSRGPMAQITANLGTVSQADSDAMATYLVSLMGDKAPRPEATMPASVLLPASAGSQIDVSLSGREAGAAIYAGACSSCHDSGRPVPFGGLALHLSSALHAPDPSNIVIVTLHGLAAPPGSPGSIMPGFDGTLDDMQIIALLAYLRADIAHEAPWPDLEKTVRSVRTRPVTLYPSDGTTAAPADTDVRIAQ